jgi:hypothetical protein
MRHVNLGPLVVCILIAAGAVGLAYALAYGIVWFMAAGFGQ